MRRFLAVFLSFALIGCGPGLADIGAYAFACRPGEGIMLECTGIGT